MISWPRVNFVNKLFVISDKMQTLKRVIIVVAACLGVAGAQLDNCDEEKWLPEGSAYTSPPECVEYDGSLVPNCGEFIVDDRTSYFHVHEYSKSLVFFLQY